MMISKLVLLVLMWRADSAFGVPSEVLTVHEAIERFQSSLQQQNFQSVLISIEDRLRNLDNIYSMQLSETLKVKLDQYHRKLETLDTKIIRLESLVMLNLDKISENISTKNYKDDLTRTQLSRRLENVYEGLGHKINYMERKFELSIDKLQTKADSTLQRLERMEDDMMQRHGDIEAELSENFSSLEEYKSSTTLIAENTLTDIANTLKVTMSQNISNTIQNLNRTIQERLDFINRGILEVFNETHLVKEKTDSMKRELKQDLNSYANKVSDLNMDIWKRNSGIEDKIKSIETVTNASRIESQNSVRALMLQIGKTSSKGSSPGLSNNDKTSMESLKKALNLSLEKIISNQELFLESCHRVQMDESQIESEISTLLGKLIDMLDVKLATAIKDLKAVEKSLKNHDSRVNRNLNQANTNIISLFDKTTKQSKDVGAALENIKLSVNSLFTFVQDVLPPRGEPHVTEKMLSDILHNITLFNLQNAENASTEVMNSLSSKQKLSEMLRNILNEKFENFINETQHTLEQSNNAVLETLKMNCSSNRETETNLVKTNSTTSTLNQSDMCSQNYRDLIDVRAGFPCNNKTVNRTYSEEMEMEANLNRTILAIFGKPPVTTELPKKDKLCPTWANVNDMRYAGNNCTMKKVVKKTKSKHRHNNYKSKIHVRFEDDSESTTDMYGVEIDETETTTAGDSMTITPTLIPEIESSTNRGED
ncbi:putative leucine-rich repeat-containing protein DDB_G0290503 [Euwallacea similis]|uniref:putative leucine-rich repeat-containing protein DDB_G0290503 n=1 Tax=Euwallacea similis TaxID=1736056 RepID=UPI003450BDD3